MSTARTEKTGTSKLVNDPGHPMQVRVKQTDYDVLRQWCHDNNTTPTQQTRELVSQFVAGLKKEN